MEIIEPTEPVGKRAEWGGKIEFILTCVGYAVGLGNIWRFPYLCYKNGGGAFIIPYFVTLLIVGMPLFFLELSLGQFASLGPIAIWKSNPLFKGIGYTMVITNTLVSCYYNVILAWSFYFLFASFTSEVPWASCSNSWNTPECTTAEQFKNLSHLNATERKNLPSPSQEYFYRKVLKMSGGLEEVGTIVWQLALCLLLSWLIVYLVLIRGISSLGKVVYFTSIFPYILLTVMLIRGVTLDGALMGITYYLSPVWSKLLEAQVWSDAATQIFFSLATCSGGLIAMASYNSFHNNCFKDSLIVPVINCLTSFYGGFVIFSVLGYMANLKSIDVSHVATGGPGLVFVVYPEALSTMPVAPLWSILFFLMMISLGLSSMFSMVECFFCAFIDEFSTYLSHSPRKIIIVRTIFCIIFYLLGLSLVTNGGFHLFTLMDLALSGFPLLIAGLIELLAFMYIYGYKHVAEDISMMLGFKPNIIFKITWHTITPLTLFLVIIFMMVQYERREPYSAEVIYWITVITVLMFIPLIGLIYFCRHGGYELTKKLMKPTQEWGPALDDNRKGRYFRQPLTRLQLLSGLNERLIRTKLKLTKRPLLRAQVSHDVVFRSDPHLNFIVTETDLYDISREQPLNDQYHLGYHGKNFNPDTLKKIVQINMINTSQEIKDGNEYGAIIPLEVSLDSDEPVINVKPQSISKSPSSPKK